LAARGNRTVGVGRFRVAFLVTAVLALGAALPAYAQEGTPPPPAETTPTETTAPDTPTQTPPADTTEPQPEPADPEPDQTDPSAEPDPAPSGDAADGGTPDSTEPAPDSAPADESTPEEGEPTAEGEPTSEAEDAVKLPPPAPVPSPAPAPATPAPQPASSAPTAEPEIVLENAPAAKPETSVVATTANAEAGADDAVIVSLRPRAAASPISLLPADEPALKMVSSAPAAKPAVKLLVQQICARPVPRVLLSQRCKQARAVVVLRVTQTYRSRPEVRAAIARAVARVTAHRDEARPPPDSKAAKKHPVAEVRPTVPFGDSGQGFTNDGFNGSTGSTWSSRLFALAAVPLKVPLPFRFARLRLPSTIPHGVIAAPPTARPG
jgi:hypothetical protein